jgi:hypothetical protein
VTGTADEDLPPAQRLARTVVAVLVVAAVAAAVATGVLTGTPRVLLRLGIAIWLSVRHFAHLP